jgi:hypothetical protein
LRPGYLEFSLDHFVCKRDGKKVAHEVLLKRVLERLFSNAPGEEFVQKWGIARGDRFFARPSMRKALLKECDEHRWILIESVRRFGKTSFLCSLVDSPPPKYAAVYLSLEGGISEDYFARALVAHLVCHQELRKSMPRAITTGLKKRMTPHEVMEELANRKRDPQEDLLRCWKRLDGHSGRVLLMVDELALYLSNVRELGQRTDKKRDEAHWREWVRSTIGFLVKAPNSVRFVLAGSLHLPAYLNGHVIRHKVMDELQLVSLSPLEDKDAETMLRLGLLQERVVASEEEVEWILDRFGGWFPSFSIYFLDLLGRECRDKNDLSRDDLERLYRSLFSDQHKNLFSDLDAQHHRHTEYVDESGFGLRLCRLLVHLCETGTAGADRKELFVDFKKQPPSFAEGKSSGEKERLFDLALTVLNHDYAVAEEGDRLVVRCPFLQDWAMSRKQEWRID